MNKSKKLILDNVNDATLQSVTGRYPKLREFFMSIPRHPDISNDVLDYFFASIPRVRKIEIDQGGKPSPTYIDLESSANFWRLPLTSLTIDCMIEHIGNDFMFTVARSFPRLQHFYMDTSNSTKLGVAALSELQELEVLDLKSVFADDEGIRQLAKCKTLRKLDLRSSEMTGDTLIALFRGCPHLEYIAISAIYEADTPNVPIRIREVASVLKSLSGIARREITIEFYRKIYCYEDTLKPCPWKSKSVEKAIRKLEEIGGLKIKIVLGSRIYADGLILWCLD